LEAITEEGETLPPPSWREKRRERQRRKKQEVIEEFLGKGVRGNLSGMLPRYYGGLLTWALHQYLERDGWEIAGTLGYHGPEPIFAEVNDGNKASDLLMDGQMLLVKGDSRFIITVDMNPRSRASLMLEGPAGKKEKMTEFLNSVFTIAEKENFYRSRNMEFSGRIRFLDVEDQAWDSIIMDAETKTEIKANTIGFLHQRERWSQYGIPAKRGILLAGEPGTGKTIICKALMSEAKGITCITTNGYALDSDDYITELYELAEDLSPSMVFIEDIDLIGQNRMEFGYHRGPALLSLLAVLDGIEERKQIITIATTNCLDTLDKALSRRPSRFDRTIKLLRPSVEQRRELIGNLCRKIPLDEETQEHIATKAESCTPAQLQEIVYSLVIQCPPEKFEPSFNRGDVDLAISRITDKNRHRLGFAGNGNSNGPKPYQIADIGGR